MRHVVHVSTNHQRGRPIEYTPPAEESIARLARQVCANLSESSDPAYGTPEVVDGFSQFLAVVSQLTAKTLTKGQGDWLEQERPVAPRNTM